MKLIDDTLKGPNGKYSRKSLTTFFSFVFSVLIGFYMVYTESTNQISLSVFFGFLGLGGGSLGLTVIDKIRNNNPEN